MTASASCSLQETASLPLRYRATRWLYHRVNQYLCREDAVSPWSVEVEVEHKKQRLFSKESCDHTPPLEESPTINIVGNNSHITLLPLPSPHTQTNAHSPVSSRNQEPQGGAEQSQPPQEFVGITPRSLAYVTHRSLKFPRLPLYSGRTDSEEASNDDVKGLNYIRVSCYSTLSGSLGGLGGVEVVQRLGEGGMGMDWLVGRWMYLRF